MPPRRVSESCKAIQGGCPISRHAMNRLVNCSGSRQNVANDLAEIDLEALVPGHLEPARIEPKLVQ